VYERSEQSLRLTLADITGVESTSLHAGEIHFRLGWLRVLSEYAFGQGCPRDGSTPLIDTEKMYGDALKPWAKAGSSGHPGALFALSQAYHTRLLGTKEDQQQKAQIYSQLAANQEHTLALEYVNGSFAERHQEFHEELEWFHSRALEQMYFVVIVTIVLGAVVAALIWVLQTQDFSFLLEKDIEEEDGDDDDDEDDEDYEEDDDTEYDEEDDDTEYDEEDGGSYEDEVPSSTDDFPAFSTDDDLEKAKTPRRGKVHFD
jgi:hypothetical protein